MAGPTAPRTRLKVSSAAFWVALPRVVAKGAARAARVPRSSVAEALWGGGEVRHRRLGRPRGSAWQQEGDGESCGFLKRGIGLIGSFWVVSMLGPTLQRTDGLTRRKELWQGNRNRIHSSLPLSLSGTWATGSVGGSPGSAGRSPSSPPGWCSLEGGQLFRPGPVNFLSRWNNSETFQGCAIKHIPSLHPAPS